MCLLQIFSTSVVQQRSPSLSFNKSVIQYRDLLISTAFRIIGRSLLLVSVLNVVMLQRVSLSFLHSFLTMYTQTDL